MTQNNETKEPFEALRNLIVLNTKPNSNSRKDLLELAFTLEQQLNLLKEEHKEVKP
jgi:hypothetical protein